MDQKTKTIGKVGGGESRRKQSRLRRRARRARARTHVRRATATGPEPKCVELQRKASV